MMLLQIPIRIKLESMLLFLALETPVLSSVKNQEIRYVMQSRKFNISMSLWIILLLRVTREV